MRYIFSCSFALFWHIYVMEQLPPNRQIILVPVELRLVSELSYVYL